MTSSLGRSFHIVTGAVVNEVIEANRDAVAERVAYAYRLHDTGCSINPDSCFLRFPEKPSARIIALPALLGGEVGKAGLKWISSFPENRAHNLARASAVLILNDYETGYPIACLEASSISAHRTAVSAVLAAEALTPWSREGVLAVVGTGVIARTTVDWLLYRGWRFARIRLYDTDRKEAERFAVWLHERQSAPACIEQRLEPAVADADIVLFATTAPAPYLNDPLIFARAPTILHLSLRDLGVDIVAASQNIVDDIEHCLKAQTSIHLARLRLGDHRFISGVLAQALDGRLAPERGRPRIFSPFGLGLLDVAVGDLVLARALAAGQAIEAPGFFANANRW